MFHPSDSDVRFSEEEFRLLRDFIHERFGLFYGDEQKASLRSRLLGRIQSLDLASFEDYYHHLRFAPERDQELHRMISHLTNNETYFFRESAQLQAFSDHVIRAVKNRKSKTGDRTLRILSAGCSTGEEAMTLAMIIYESAQFFWNWEVRVFGLDVDPEALEKGRKGIYFHNAFRGTNPQLLERHFIKRKAGSEIKEPIRRLVHFREGNLLDSASYEGLRPLDAIFCRNVLIYFSDLAILRAVRIFHENLADGGFLLLGHAESLSRHTDLFTPIRFQGAMIYQKPGGDGK